MLKIFVFIDIWFVKQDIQKWLKTKICSFFGECGNERKKDKIFLTFLSMDSNPQIFSNFPAHDLNFHIFMEGEGDEIKSKQASKRDRALKEKR